MFKKSKGYISLILLAMVPVVCFFTTLTSTLAWYAYNTNVNMTYVGTSVESSEQLQIGIKTDLDMTAFNMETEGDYAWAQPGSGLKNEALNFYLEKNGFATTELAPVTSAKYEDDQVLSLYKSPNDEIPGQVEEAFKENYVKIPICFRVINIATNKAVKNQPIWLNEVALKGKTKEVENALRIHFDNSEDRFIVNPRASEDGSNRVAGTLDLTDDGYYDYDSSGKQVIYGYYDGTPEYEFIAQDSELDDVNHTQGTTATSFLSKHKANTYKVSNLDAICDRFASYYSLSSVMGQRIDGRLSGGKPVVTTPNTEAAIADASMTIWIEGWDFSCIDSINGLSFTLSLLFEINGF